MNLLMISHLLGDFYFQTDKVSEKKKYSLKYLLLHVIIYALSVYCMFVLTTGKWQKYICTVIIIGIGHFILDFIKIKLENKYANIAKYKLLVLAVDQILHVAILWALIQKAPLKIDMSWFPLSLHWLLDKVNEISIVIISVLLCGKPAAIIVSLVFEKIPQSIHSTENVEDNIPANTSENLKIGSWIGILEREIILILGLLGQYGAIGFVLTAKSLARHSQLNDPTFAEKYLVGTLLSSFIALLNVAICNLLI